LWRVMPITAVCGMLAALSMAGAPPLFGFIGKELLLKAKLNLDYLGVVLIIVASLANILLIAMALVVAVWPFFGRRVSAAESAHEAPVSMLVGPLVLAVMGLFVGLLPGTFDSALGSAMATAVGGRVIMMDLKLWHGLSPSALTALGISVVSLGLGFLLFVRLRDWLMHIVVVVARLGRRGPARAYEVVFAGLLAFSENVTRMTQTGSLRRYVRVILLTLIVTVSYPLARCLTPADALSTDWFWHEILLVLLTLVGAIAAVSSRSAMSGIALLGITGFMIAILFALFSAPDLAITQIMVEALTVILLVLVFHRLPGFSLFRDRYERAIDATVAVLAGAIMAWLILATATVHLPTTVSDQLSRMAKPDAYGRNVVNVILVDFRALDTLGEITVVAVAGLGVYALMKLARKRKPEGSGS